MKSIIEPEEVASEMLWVGSYSACFVNGEVIVLDGGMGITSADYTNWEKR